MLLFDLEVFLVEILTLKQRHSLYFLSPFLQKYCEKNLFFYE